LLSIFESLGTGVCVYPPEKRDEYCYCFERSINTELPFFHDLDIDNNEIYCDINGETGECSQDRIDFNTKIEGFRAKCGDESGDNINARMVYKVENRNDEIVYEGTVMEPDEEGYYNLTGIDYEVENAGELNITASCIHECY
jgi:hypothetical protein